MNAQQRRDRPRPPRARRRGRVRRAIIVTSGVVALVAALLLPMVDTMAWLGLDDGDEGQADASARLLEAEGDTPGERVVDVLVKESKPQGYKAGKTVSAVSDVYSLSCLDGAMAWASARTRTFAKGDGEAAITAAVYPAGGGGAAFAEALEAADACAEAVGETEYGIDGATWRRGASTTQVMRRGDVVVVLSASTEEALPSAPWLRGVDDRLAALLEVDCVDEAAPAAASLRNPFIDPEAFIGNTVSARVPFPRVAVTRAEDVATDPVVPLDAVPPVVPEAVPRPEPLDPAPTALPELPAEVARPEAPVPPVAPESTGRALRGVADSAGPGCGWDFTGQSGPRFDVQKAEAQYRAAIEEEETRLVDEAVAFEQGKVNFYRAWADHQNAVLAYRQYSDALALAVAQWQVVIDARAAFVRAFEEYRAEGQAYDDFATRQNEARENFEAEVVRCQALSPLELLTPGSGCPPERPSILDEFAPVVSARPLPSPEAQLPDGWEPPAAG